MIGFFRALTDGLIKKKLGAVMREGRRRMVKAGLFAFCGLAATGSLIFVAVGAYLSLCRIFAPWLSGLMVGGGILVLSLAGSLVLWLFVGDKEVPNEKPPRDRISEKTQVDNAAYLGELIGTHLNRHGLRTFDVALAALVAGAVLGAGPALRARRRRRKDEPPWPSTSQTDRRRSPGE